MNKQTLIVTLGELRELTIHLLKEELKQKALEPNWADPDQKREVNIVNKEGMSDTWKIQEKGE